MYLFDGDDGKDDERFRNFMIFKFWGTDEELEQATPVLGIIGLIVVIGVVLYFCLK